MGADASFAAVDLGASSGRVCVATVGPDRLDLTELHRFANRPVRLPDGLHWDLLALYGEILAGLRGAAAHDVVSLGVDSWAVDYGLLDADGALIGNPYHYRDSRTDGVADAVLGRLGADALYAVNGLQFLPFNTIFQLAAARDTAALAAAGTLLLVPDLIGYWLTGARGAETTNASTTGLRDVTTGGWATDLLDRLDLPTGLLPPLRAPGDPVGGLLAGAAADIGLPAGLPVTAVASHDTASAVVAVPAADERFAYVSCGTWSLVGVELPAPVLTDDARTAGFTNEVGVDDTIRFLRNVTGLWPLQESMRAWGNPALDALLAAAAEVPALRRVLDVADPAFLPPGDMPARIAAQCRRTGQAPPADRAETVRAVLDGLALAHRAAVRDAGRLSGRAVDTVHLVGGGARNALLCQLTADACELPVVAGPVEATALGNVLVQARAHGATLDARELVRRTQPTVRYEPTGDPRPWRAAADRLASGVV